MAANSSIDASANLNRWRKKSLLEKSLLAFGMLVIAVSVPSYYAALLVTAVMVCATLIGAGIAFSLWWKVATAPLSFLLLGSLTLIFQVELWHVGIAPDGLETAARVCSRALAGTSCLLFLALTTPAADLISGLRKIGVPREIAEMTLLIYNFVFVLISTAETMNTAQQARLGHVTYRRHMQSLGLLIANLMPRALARAQALEVGLAARGWQGDLLVLSPVRRASPAGIAVILALELLVLLIGMQTR